MRRLPLLLLAALCWSCVGDAGSSSGGVPIPAPGAEPVAAAEAAPDASPDAEPLQPAPASGGQQASGQIPAPDARPVFERPEHVRALYLNAWAAGSTKRMDQMIEVARRTEINSFVIDIKDASGFVSHRTGVPVAKAIGATGEIRIRDLPGLLKKLEAAGIYPIARIVIVRDPILAKARPALAVQDSSGGAWVDGKGIIWMNIANRDLWDYELDLAEEVVELGFPEIQWDYVRFPDAPRGEMAHARFPGTNGRAKEEVVRAFLEYADQRLDSLGLDVTHTADVFGITTSTVDVGIGQVWERFIDRVDYALPMVYPSHYYRGSFGYDRPNSYPYEIVRAALERAMERSQSVPGAGKIRPYLQDFSLGQPAYGAPEVRAQIQATYDAGVEDWVLWNAGSHYSEDALQPEDGWKEEPTLRIGNRLVPMSRRFEALKAPAAAAPAPKREESRPAAPPKREEPRPEPAAAPTERTLPRVLDADSLRRWIDSVNSARDR